VRFNVEDFGLEARGRCLERVSVEANSSTVQVHDGSILAGDIGKHISIPGAVDMDATILELAEFRRIEGAAIVAGHDELTFALEEEADGFRGSVHEGWRITVEGAGDDGNRLVTSVAEVLEPRSKLRLAEPAVIGVSPTTATLNQPDRVLLSDHARATVGPVTVHLKDRTVNDALMIVGSKVLRSATASFSADDLATPVTIQGAGHLATTISGAIDDVSVTVAATAQRTVIDGIADVWDPSADAFPGFLSVLEAIAMTGVGPAEIVFGAGVYDFTRPPHDSPVLDAPIGLDGLTGVTIRGAGCGVTILRLMPEQDMTDPDTHHVLDTHVFMTRDCREVTLRDLTIHGAYLTMRQAVAQMHGVHIAQGCEDTVIDNLGVVHCAGDAVRLVGEPTNQVRRVRINGCRLVRSKRTGVAVQRSVETVWIRDCYIEMGPESTGACIDLEPSGQGAPEDLFIESNTLVHDSPAVAVSLSGTSNGPPARRIRFTANNLTGGGMGGVNAEDVLVSDNLVTAGPTGQVLAFRGMNDLRIADNVIVAPGEPRTGITVSRHNTVDTTRVRITGNEIDVGGTGIDVISGGSHLVVCGNRIFGAGSSIGIRVELIVAPIHRDIRIADNSATNFGVAGIRLVAKRPPATGAVPEPAVEVLGVGIRGNHLHVDTPAPRAGLAGISLEGPTGDPVWLRRVVIEGNRISDNVPRKIDRPTVPFIAIAGNPDGTAVYEGQDPPNDLVPAPPGSIYLQTDSTSAAVMFLKTIGTDDQGWAQLATL
jgi:hypothetical protein